MAGFNDYQSGGKGFNSPDKIIENATYREFMQQAGGKEGLAFPPPDNHKAITWLTI